MSFDRHDVQRFVTKGVAVITVYHDGYGCETGCCGSRAAGTSATGETVEAFDFMHDAGRDLAREVGAAYVCDEPLDAKMPDELHCDR